MRRRTIIVGLALTAVVSTRLCAQTPGHVPVIGVLLPGTQESYGPFTIGPLNAGFRDLGWAEGKNFTLELRWAEGLLDQLPTLATDLVSRKVDIIVTFSRPATAAARNATPNIPIVQASGGDLVYSRLVESLAHPGGNITGIINLNEDLSTKLLELLLTVVPDARRIGALVNPNEQINGRQFTTIRDAAQTLHIETLSFAVVNAAALDDAFARLSGAQLGGLIVLSDPMLLNSNRRIADLAAKARVPAIYPFREFAANGGLMSYAISLGGNARRAAAYVKKILQGAKPADLPIEQPTKLELVINLKAARDLGLTVPPSLLASADEVIE